MTEFLTWNNYQYTGIVPEVYLPLVYFGFQLITAVLVLCSLYVVVDSISNRWLDKYEIEIEANNIDVAEQLNGRMPAGYYCYAAMTQSATAWKVTCNAMRRNCEKCPFAIRILTTGKRRRK